MTHRQAAIAVVVGGILVAVGSLLPWATATTGFGSISIAGTDGDGKITLVLGAVAALVGFLSIETTSQGLRVTAFIAGALAGLAGAMDYSSLDKRLNEASSDAIRASIGPGLYLVLVGAVAIGWGAVSLKPDAAAAGEPPGAPAGPPVEVAPGSGLGARWDRVSTGWRVLIVIVVGLALLIGIPFLRGLIPGR